MDKTKQRFLQLETELRKYEEEYEEIPKKTFLAVLYYNSTIRSLKKKISHLKKELEKEDYN